MRHWLVGGLGYLDWAAIELARRLRYAFFACELVPRD